MATKKQAFNAIRRIAFFYKAHLSSTKLPHYLKGHRYNWALKSVHSLGHVYKCGYCSTNTSPLYSIRGPLGVDGRLVDLGGWLHFCPVCSQPTFVDFAGAQVPGVRFGANLTSVPEDGLKQLYDEARDCFAVSAHTACVMVCRKILMNLAVREGAVAGQSFVSYVTYLEANGFVPPKGKAWVDEIRAKGNDANHEIPAIEKADAERILTLVEMLLRFNFELGTP